MSEHRERVSEQALVYIECPGSGCDWSGPIMADVDTTYAMEKEMAFPRCGCRWTVRAELDLEVSVKRPAPPRRGCVAVPVAEGQEIAEGQAVSVKEGSQA
jgi:hypothetical protein